MNIHPDGDIYSVPIVVLKILWRQFYGVDWNCTAYRNSWTYFWINLCWIFQRLKPPKLCWSD